MSAKPTDLQVDFNNARSIAQAAKLIIQRQLAFVDDPEAKAAQIEVMETLPEDVPQGKTCNAAKMIIRKPGSEIPMNIIFRIGAHIHHPCTRDDSFIVILPDGSQNIRVSPRERDLTDAASSVRDCIGTGPAFRRNTYPFE